jgi:hypothetical protein
MLDGHTILKKFEGRDAIFLFEFEDHRFAGLACDLRSR